MGSDNSLGSAFLPLVFFRDTLWQNVELFNFRQSF